MASHSIWNNILSFLRHLHEHIKVLLACPSHFPSTSSSRLLLGESPSLTSHAYHCLWGPGICTSLCLEYNSPSPPTAVFILLFRSQFRHQLVHEKSFFLILKSKGDSQSLSKGPLYSNSLHETSHIWHFLAPISIV